MRHNGGRKTCNTTSTLNLLCKKELSLFFYSCVYVYIKLQCVIVDVRVFNMV